LIGWLVDQPVGFRASLVSVAVALPISLVFAAIISRSRVRQGMAAALPPPTSSLHETSANARDRRVRALTLLFLGVVSLLVLDRVTGGVGTAAGIVVGATAALGTVDLVEARRWARLEATERLRLHILLPSRALVGGLSPSSIYATPSGDEPPTGADPGRLIRLGSQTPHDSDRR
jgi:hypothetical protein